MTREELLNLEVIKIKDIQEAYKCCYHKAADIVRAIKDFNDRLGIRGVVHQLDYQEYMNAKSRIKKESSPRLENNAMTQ